MTHDLQHGSILGGVAVVPDLAAALRDYRDILGMSVVEQGVLPANLAESWGCPESSGAPMATLQPASGADCHIRLVEQPDRYDFKPTTSFGWAAFELSVQDVFGWPDRLEGSGFDVVGPPKELAGMPYFVPMQVLGTGREMVYLNEVRENTPSSDLPKALSPTDHIFIVILAAVDRAATVQWYCDHILLTEADTYTLAYSMINAAFDKPANTLSVLTMVQNGRLPIIEVDDYPVEATVRGRHDGMLPPGNALVSLAVDDLDMIDVEWITAPQKRDAAPYGGRRTATTVGPAGELLELIEIA
tara:strand:+ start:28831 stop:29733 length:903 start_codon:yes stop_codon:yes gene_type:complete